MIEPYISVLIKKSECSNKKCYKRSSVAEDLIDDATCAVKYELPTFKISGQYLNNFNLVWLEPILIHLNKPKLLKKEFEYTIASFN